MDIEIETNPRNKTTLTIEKLTAYESVDLGTQEGAVVKMTDSTIIGGKTVIYGFKNKITIERSTLSVGHRTADEIRISLLNANCKTPNSRRNPHQFAERKLQDTEQPTNPTFVGCSLLSLNI